MPLGHLGFHSFSLYVRCTSISWRLFPFFPVCLHTGKSAPFTFVTASQIQKERIQLNKMQQQKSFFIQFNWLNSLNIRGRLILNAKREADYFPAVIFHARVTNRPSPRLLLRLSRDKSETRPAEKPPVDFGTSPSPVVVRVISFYFSPEFRIPAFIRR